MRKKYGTKTPSLTRDCSGVNEADDDITNLKNLKEHFMKDIEFRDDCARVEVLVHACTIAQLEGMPVSHPLPSTPLRPSSRYSAHGRSCTRRLKLRYDMH